MTSARNLAIHGKQLVEQNKALRQVLLEIGIKSEFEIRVAIEVWSRDEIFYHINFSR